MLNAFTTSRERMPSEPVSTIARWLANQRATAISTTESTAWQIIEEARDGGLEFEGPRAPLIVQPRFSLWLVGQLGGTPLMHVLASEESAAAKAREIGANLKLPVISIDTGGDIVSRFDPPQHVSAPRREASVETIPPKPELRAKASDTKPVVDEPTSAIVLKVARHEGRWAVFIEGRLVATAPTRDKARQRARLLKADPDFAIAPRPDPQD